MVEIDGNKHYIVFDSELSYLRENAEKRKKIYHYCPIEKAIEILKTRSLLLKCIKDYDKGASYERQGVNQEFEKIIFVSCFSHEDDEREMWEEFADNATGVKFSFYGKNILDAGMIDYNRKIGAYDKNQQLQYTFGYYSSSAKESRLFADVKHSSEVVARLILSDVEYAKSIPNSLIYVGDKKGLNISTVSCTVLDRFINENETRIIGILQSTHRVELADISYLLLPLDFNSSKITVEFGELCKSEDKKLIRELFNNAIQEQLLEKTSK